jgi:hypothetical protein
MGSTRHVGHFWSFVPAPYDCDDGEFGEMKMGKGNRSIPRKPAPAPLYPPQIPLDQTRARTRAAAVGSQRLTALAIARLDDGLTPRSAETTTVEYDVKIYQYNCI